MQATDADEDAHVGILPEHAAALRRAGLDPSSSKVDWLEVAGQLAAAYEQQKERLMHAEQQATALSAALQQISTVVSGVGVRMQPYQGQAAAGPSEPKAKPPSAPAVSLLKRTRPQHTVAVAKKVKTEALPSESLIQVERIAGALPPQAVLEAGSTVQVWRIVYQGKQYFVEVDAVLLCGNALSEKLMIKVSVQWCVFLLSNLRHYVHRYARCGQCT